MASTAEEIFDALPGGFAEAEGKEFALEVAAADQADLWGDVRYQYAIAYRAAATMQAAGFGATGGGSAATGGVTSKRIGSLSVSYATSASSSTGALANTSYGKLLEDLIAGAVVPIEVADCTPLYGYDGGHAVGPWEYSQGRWRWWLR